MTYVPKSQRKRSQRKRNLDEIKASIQQSVVSEGLILRLSISEWDKDDLLLEAGKQPPGIFDSIIITVRKI